ncbi:segregation/condensation protein A, partial [Vibrio vulnificus]
DEASEFLVIAATLLDLKAARLLPQGEVEDEEDIALLEARDLLFARLLQYKALKQVATLFGRTFEQEGQCSPRQVSLEAPFAALLPELIWKYT